MPPFPTLKLIEHRLEIHAKNHPNYCCSAEPFWVSFWKPKSSSKRDRNHAKTTLFSQKASKMPPRLPKKLQSMSKKLPRSLKMLEKATKQTAQTAFKTTTICSNLKLAIHSSHLAVQMPHFTSNTVQFPPLHNSQLTTRGAHSTIDVSSLR